MDRSDESIHITLKAIGGETTGITGGTYRGLWAVGGSALYQERWAVVSGPYAGMYVCINPAGTALNPWQGVDWHREPSSVDVVGNWT